ncbi:MAG: 6,7-dimethyl-8-ribityllumazine synthase [Bacteroidetes bacterium]|nr:MAG: 6,7-dimethyl-8-ribityllumazine synthase [Bacteroidota bacterium]
MATANKNLSNYDKNTMPNASSMRFGIVVSEWNEEITEGLFRGAYDTLIDLGVAPHNIIRENVPGSFELPFGAKCILESEKVDAVIAIGVVIQGETKHFDFVCSGVTQGIVELNNTYSAPTMFCVLTDMNIEQSRARSGGEHGNKGVEAAVAAVKMADLKRRRLSN